MNVDCGKSTKMTLQPELILITATKPKTKNNASFINHGEGYKAKYIETKNSDHISLNNHGKYSKK